LPGISESLVRLVCTESSNYFNTALKMLVNDVIRWKSKRLFKFMNLKRIQVNDAV